MSPRPKPAPALGASLPVQLRRLFCSPEAQRYARQVDGAAEYPHEKGRFVTDRLLAQHAAGDETVALLLVASDRSARLGAIDVDVPRDAADLAGALGIVVRLAAAARARGLRPLVEFSGRRGFHLLVPLLDPLPASTVRQAMAVIARDADFSAEEIFPTTERPAGERRGEAQVLKLPAGVHRVTGWRSWIWPGELDSPEALAAAQERLQRALPAGEGQEPLEPIPLQEQAEYLAGYVANAPSALEEVAGQLTVPDLTLLPDGEHPACIEFRLAAGADPGRQYHDENGLLARYCAQRGLDEGEARELAVAMHEASLANEHPTTKAAAAAAKDFRQWFRDCSDESRGLQFRCSSAVGGGRRAALEAVSAGACAGPGCPCWPWPEQESAPETRARKESFQRTGKGEKPRGDSDSPDGSLHSRRLWLGIQGALQAGSEIRLSTALAAAPEAPEGATRSTDLADRLAEREFLAHLLHHSGDAAELLAGLELPAEAFSGRSGTDWEEWAEALLADSPCSRETWLEHRDRLLDRASRTLAGSLGISLATGARDLELQPADTLTAAIDAGAQLLRHADPELQPMGHHLAPLLAELLATDAPAIPLRHPGLRRTFGGGLRPGRLVMCGGPPGCGKTTLAAQLGDEAAADGHPVLFVSHEMTRGQLLLASLSRISGIDARELQREPPQPGTAAGKRFRQAVGEYLQRIAPRLFLIDGGPQHTPGRIRAMVQQLRHQLHLPETAPVLVLIDYLQLCPLGAEGEASMPEPLRVGALATAMKQLARATAATVWCLSDVTKEVFDQAAAGGRLGSGVFRDSARILHACDTALALQSGLVHPGKGKPPQTLIEHALAQPGLSASWRKQLEGADRPRENPGETFSKLTVLKNRGGAAGQEIWSRYERHLHRYRPVLPCDLGKGPVPDESSGGDDAEF